mmetsp:Transcript_22311/g.47024  ORF Transcript_22311/g.47024 Transcript_22311/m.47024 type:complete len:371 (-) Transcript_22311:144-1256(-)
MVFCCLHSPAQSRKGKINDRSQNDGTILCYFLKRSSDFLCEKHPLHREPQASTSTINRLKLCLGTSLDLPCFLKVFCLDHQMTLDHARTLWFELYSKLCILPLHERSLIGCDRPVHGRVGREGCTEISKSHVRISKINLMNSHLIERRFQLNHILNIIPGRHGTELLIQIKLLIPLHAKTSKLTPILLGTRLLLIKTIRHRLLLHILRADLLLIRPILELLRTSGVHLGILFQQLVGVAGGGTPGIFGGHHFGFGELRDVIHFFEALLTVAGHAHLSVASVEFLEVDEALEGSGAEVFDLGFVHFGGLEGLCFGVGIVVFCVEVGVEIIEVAVEWRRGGCSCLCTWWHERDGGRSADEREGQRFRELHCR